MISPTNQLPQHYVRETWKYRDGHLWWREPKQGRRIGKPLGCVCKQWGYRVTYHHKKNYRVHILIWNYHNGDVPQGLNIDHINRDRADNRIENLRLATDAIQATNASHVEPLSGHMGIRYRKARKVWRVRLGKHRAECKEMIDAYRTRKSWEQELWGFTTY